MKTYIKAIILAVSLVVTFTSCDLLGGDTVTPEERLADFQANLNGSDRTNTYQYIYSSASMYDQIKSSTWWDNTPFSSTYNSFVFSVIESSDVGGVKTYTGTMTRDGISFSAIITFKEDGADIWYIATITLDGTILIY